MDFSPGRLQLTLRRFVARTRDVLGAFRGDDVTEDVGLHSQHTLPGQFTVGARLGYLTAVAVEGQSKTNIKGKLCYAVVPVITRRELELRILTSDGQLSFGLRHGVFADRLAEVRARQ